MMDKINTSKITYILWSTLSGTISFFISGVIVCITQLHLDIVIFDTIIAGGIGGLLLGILLRKSQKISKVTIAGFIAVPIGFWTSFILGEAFFSIPFIHACFANPNIPDIIAIIFMGILCGAVFGAIVYGRKAVWLFSAVGGAVSFPFGLLVAALNSGYYIKTWLENMLAIFGKIDLNLLAIVMSLGIGIGLSIGLFSMLKQRSIDGSL